MSDGDGVQRLRGQLRVLVAIWEAVPEGNPTGTAAIWSRVRAVAPCSYEALILALCYLEAQGILLRDQAEDVTFWRRQGWLDTLLAQITQ